MLLSLPPLYPITDLKLARAGSHAELVRCLIAGGARWIQLREKDLPPEELSRQVRQSCEVADSAGVILVLNDWVDIAQTTSVAGVHLGQADLPAEEARQKLAVKIIGLSTHSLEQAQAAMRLPVDYIAIGPVFATPTNTDHPPLGIEVLHQVRSAVNKPLVAIGGITLSNVAEVWSAGVDSAAVISDIMGHRDIARQTENYLRLWNKLHA